MGEARTCSECGNVLPADAPEGLCPSCLLNSGLSSGWMMSPRKPTMTPVPGPFVAPPPAELARHFPQLEIVELLGQGGMGAVYQARQTKLDRLVALKVLPPHLVQDPAFAERFTREARALARLNHPNIVSVHDFGESGGLYYFIMEYVDGASLREVLLEGRLAPAESLKIVSQLCDALQYAHDEGIVHRDIKPENILLDKKGRVKIADFGLAKLVGAVPANYTLTGSRQIMGTPHYMAPEQMEKPQTVDHRADIYSLGVVFYEMLTGELPLGRFAAPSKKADVDGRLDEVIHRALAKEPHERYQRISDLKAEVETPLPLRAGDLPARPAKRSVGVRFVASKNWFTQAGGLISLEGDELVFEYEETYFGCYQMGVKEKRVRLGEISRIYLDKGWWSANLHITTSRLNSLDGVPGKWMGQVALPITGEEIPHAEELVRQISVRTGGFAGFLAAGEKPLTEFEQIQQRLAMPAGALLAAAIIGIINWLVAGIVATGVNLHDDYQEFGGAGAFAALVFGVGLVILCPVLLMVYGSRAMRRLDNRALVITAAMVALIPWSLHVLLGFPLGIWILVLMRRHDVKQAFAWRARPQAKPQAAPPQAETPKPTGFIRRRARSVLRGFRTLFFDSYAAPVDESAQVHEDPRQIPTSLHTPPPVPPVPEPAPSAEPRAFEAERVVRELRSRRRRRILKAVAVAWLVGIAIFVAFAGIRTARSSITITRRDNASSTRPRVAVPVRKVDPDQAIQEYLQPLRLEPPRRAEATSALKDLYAKYVELESKNTTQVVDSTGRLRVTIAIPRDEWKPNEVELWRRLEDVLTVEQQQKAQQSFASLGELFSSAYSPTTIEIWQKGRVYYWDLNSYREAYGGRSEPRSGNGSKLPPDLQRFWEHTRDARQGSATKGSGGKRSTSDGQR